MATAPTRPSRRSRIWFALIGLTLLLLVCVAPVTIGAAMGRGPVSITIAPPDPDSAMVHHHWVSAMLSGDEPAALELLAEPDPARRQQRVRSYLSRTDALIRLTAAGGLLGPYLERFELLGSVTGEHERQRTGLSEVYFARGSLCYATRMEAIEGTWRVIEWASAGNACARFLEKSLPGAPPGREAGAEIAAVHTTWANAMFSGDVAAAAPLVAEAGAEERQHRAQFYAELTAAVVGGGAERFGPRQGYEILKPFPQNARHQVGYARAVYERGQLCFRADLHYREGQWLVNRWSLVIPEACVA
ncbi:MAG: hypothetical protein N2378_06090 [Chloroflexaceae bacterium]|nr:hypothetical protein [Chloroflexaceae bacterium]